MFLTIPTGPCRKRSNTRNKVSRSTTTARRRVREKHVIPQVLLACALANTDPHGYFTAGDVVTPMSVIMGKPCDTVAFSQHLNALCENIRGPALQRVGVPRAYRYKFRNAILRPYVIMQSLETKLISETSVTHAYGLEFFGWQTRGCSCSPVQTGGWSLVLASSVRVADPELVTFPARPGKVTKRRPPLVHRAGASPVLLDEPGGCGTRSRSMRKHVDGARAQTVLAESSRPACVTRRLSRGLASERRRNAANGAPDGF